MTLISDMATQTLYYRRRTGSGDGQGEIPYEPDADSPPTPFSCVWEPGYSDPGRDSSETRNGRILTETPLSLRDLVLTDPSADVGDAEAQEVTQVNPQFDFNGDIDFYEVFL